MAGILSAIKLREAGLGDVVIYEKASRLGGTWRENTYPGIACDVPSHLYCYSFAPNPDWSHRFSPGGEIQAYLERVARAHGVDRLIRFGDEVTRCELAGGRWRLWTARGERAEAPPAGACGLWPPAGDGAEPAAAILPRASSITPATRTSRGSSASAAR